MTDLTIKSQADIKADILRTIRNGLIEQGIPNPNLSDTSDFGLSAEALSTEVAIAENNVVLASSQLMPDTATGPDLDRFLSIYGLARRSASSATGSVIVSASSATLVPTGAQLVSPAGLKYQVLLGGVFGNGASLEVQAIDTGSQTDLPGGTVLSWVASPPYFAPTVSVSSVSPLTGGVDTEDDETARARLLYRLANPPGAGNAAQLIEFALASSPSVQAAFVSPAARGPSTVDITVVGYATSTSKSRTLDPVLLSNTISPFILGNLPQFVDGYIANSQNYPIDVSIALSLPNPITAIPAGPGGGFLDASPMATTSAKPAIRIVDGYALSGNNAAIPQNTATSFWIDAPIAPVSGANYNISYLSPATWTLYNATTNGSYPSFASYSVSGHSSLVYLTINSPFYQNASINQIVQPGNWIFPTAVNTSVYVASFLNYMANMGPGERTNISGLLPRALRLPPESQSWNYKLNNRALKPIIDSGAEVYDGAILFRGTGGTTDSGGFVDYGLTDSTYSPPCAYVANGTALGNSYIFVPNNFGIYSQS